MHIGERRLLIHLHVLTVLESNLVPARHDNRIVSIIAVTMAFQEFVNVRSDRAGHALSQQRLEDASADLKRLLDLAIRPEDKQSMGSKLPGNFALFDRVRDPLCISFGENGIKLHQRAAALRRIAKVGVSSKRDLSATRLAERILGERFIDVY